MVVHATYWTLIVLVAAPMAGLAGLVTQLLGRSGEAAVSFQILRQSRTELIAIILYDVIGGIVCAAVVIIFGITRPPAIVQGFHDQPGIAWALVGAVGPLVSAGLIDRLPITLPLAQFRDERGEVAGGDRHGGVGEVRLQASRRVYRKLYLEIQIREGVERDDQARRARRLLWAGALHVDKVAEQLTRVAETDHDELPQKLHAALAERAQYDREHVPLDYSEKVVDIAIDLGYLDQVFIACSIAEATQSNEAEQC